MPHPDRVDVRWSRSSAVTALGLFDVGEVSRAADDLDVGRGRWAAISSAKGGGVAGSSAPAMTTVGAVTCWRSGRRSIAAMASQQPAYPSAEVARSIARCASTTSRRAAANPGVNQRLTTASATAAVPEGAHDAGSVTPGLRRREDGGGAHEGQALDAARLVAGEPHADHPAEGHAGPGEPVDAEAIEQGDDVDAEVGDRGRPLDDLGAAVAPMIDGDDTEVLGQYRQLGVPHRAGRAQRRPEHEHGGSRVTGLDVVQESRHRLAQGSRRRMPDSMAPAGSCQIAIAVFIPRKPSWR